MRRIRPGLLLCGGNVSIGRMDNILKVGILTEWYDKRVIVVTCFSSKLVSYLAFIIKNFFSKPVKTSPASPLLNVVRVTSFVFIPNLSTVVIYLNEYIYFSHRIFCSGGPVCFGPCFLALVFFATLVFSRKVATLSESLDPCIPCKSLDSSTSTKCGISTGKSRQITFANVDSSDPDVVTFPTGRPDIILQRDRSFFSRTFPGSGKHCSYANQGSFWTFLGVAVHVSRQIDNELFRKMTYNVYHVASFTMPNC